MKQICRSFRRFGIFGGLLFLCFRMVADSVQLQLPADMAINKGAACGKYLFVTVRLENGENLPFIVDTGSPCTLLDKSFASKLGKQLGTMPIDMVRHDQQKAGCYVSPKLYLGNVALVTGSNIYAYHFDEHFEQARGAARHGLFPALLHSIGFPSWKDTLSGFRQSEHHRFGQSLSADAFTHRSQWEICPPDNLSRRACRRKHQLGN